VVVVTGGSEGIGLALARQFASAGNDVMLVARRPGPLEEAAASIRRQFKVQAFIAPVDITAGTAIETLDAALSANSAYADVLVNSAGTGLAGRFLDHSQEDVLRLVDVNMRALTRLMRHFLEPMRMRGRGGILNIASIGAYSPGPNQAVYYASKAYMLSLSEAVAAETAGQGVRVCALAPGPVNTRFHERMGTERALYRLLLPSSPTSVARAGYLGFTLGWRVIIPGVLNPFLALAMRVLPHRIVIPILAQLLKPRGRLKNDVRG
jgi:uncharacterized protein